MRRMKIEPMTFYPVTELQETTSDYIALYLNSDITKKLKTSPHAIYLLITANAVCADHGGALEFKMMPAKSNAPEDNLVCAYFDIKVTDDNRRVYAYCYLYDEDNKACVFLELRNLDGTLVTDFGQSFNSILTSYESKGFGLGNLINIAIEPVSNSVSVLSYEV